MSTKLIRQQRQFKTSRILQPKASTSVLIRSTKSYTTTSIKMSGIEKVSTKTGAPPAAPYSQAIKANGQIWVSGQIPANEHGALIEGSISDKTAQCCKNIKAIVEAAGSQMEKVVRVGVFLDDMAHFKEMNEEYAKWFSHKPSRSCIAVKQLPMGVPVEIEAIALQ